MHIGVDVSKKQMSRLKNGHSVRVKKGEGLLIVNPQRYDLMSRAFLSGKASTISLTPEEILANARKVNPEAHQEEMGTQMQDNSKLAVPKSSTYKGTPTEKDLNREGLAELQRKILADQAKYKAMSEQKRKEYRMKQIVLLLKQAKYRQEYPEDVESIVPNRPYLPVKRPDTYAFEKSLSDVARARPVASFPTPRPTAEKPESALFGAFATAPSASKYTQDVEKQKGRQKAFEELPLGFGIGKFVSNAGGHRTKSGNYAGNYLQHSALENASANHMQEQAISFGINRARKNMYVVGMGVSSHHRPRTEGVGVGGNVLRQTNPALRPQPFSSSFQLASTLPPSFQRLHNSV